jgi:hypothetical protein
MQTDRESLRRSPFLVEPRSSVGAGRRGSKHRRWIGLNGSHGRRRRTRTDAWCHSTRGARSSPGMLRGAAGYGTWTTADPRRVGQVSTRLPCMRRCVGDSSRHAPGRLAPPAPTCTSSGPSRRPIAAWAFRAASRSPGWTGSGKAAAIAATIRARLGGAMVRRVAIDRVSAGHRRAGVHPHATSLFSGSWERSERGGSCRAPAHLGGDGPAGSVGQAARVSARASALAGTRS